VYRLALWGFQLHGEVGVLQAVADAARVVFRGSGRPEIRRDRVEQIYEAWRERVTKKRAFPPLQPKRYKRASLRHRQPNIDLMKLAIDLLKHHGRWPSDEDTFALPVYDLSEAEERKLDTFAPRTRAHIPRRTRGRPKKNTDIR
jgi:hypothetical protein